MLNIRAPIVGLNDVISVFQGWTHGVGWYLESAETKYLHENKRQS